MQDFWRNSGFHALALDQHGRLRVSVEFLRLYLSRPELAPIEESCPAERALHAMLLEDPGAPVGTAWLAKIADPDARDNYRLWLRFRDRLLVAGTLQGFYLRHFRERSIDIPPLMLDQVAQAILRGLLDGTEDPILVRTAELFFRRQAVSLQDGTILLADADTVEMYQMTGGFGSVGRLLVQADTAPRELKLEVLGINNAALYWMRDERFDTVLDMSPGREAVRCLCRLMEMWVEHFLDIEVSITSLTRIEDEHWVWHSGLDAESTAILNDLYVGKAVEDERSRRLISLFRLDFKNPAETRGDVAGRPVYLGLATAPDLSLRLKAQNLLLNLPLATPA